MSRWTAPGVAGAAAVWLLLIITAPILWTPAAAVIYLAGSLICHQLPDRSFHVDGSQLPVCARCFGLYFGAALGSAAGATVLGRRRFGSWWTFAGRRSTRIATVAAAVPTAVTFVLEWGFGWPVSNGMRAIAAIPLAFCVAFVVVSRVATVDYD